MEFSQVVYWFIGFMVVMGVINFILGQVKESLEIRNHNLAQEQKQRQQKTEQDAQWKKESEERNQRIERNSQIVISVKGDLIPVKYDTHFLKSLTDNQNKFDDILLQNLLKLEIYIKTRVDVNNKLLIKLDDNTLYRNDKLFNNLIQECKSSNGFLKNLVRIANEMIQSFLSGDRVRFFLIYNKFEDLGVFTKEWERRLLSSIENINESLQDVLDEISSLESSLSSSLLDLELAIKNIE